MVRTVVTVMAAYGHTALYQDAHASMQKKMLRNRALMHGHWEGGVLLAGAAGMACPTPQRCAWHCARGTADMALLTSC